MWPRTPAEQSRHPLQGDRTSVSAPRMAHFRQVGVGGGGGGGWGGTWEDLGC